MEFKPVLPPKAAEYELSVVESRDQMVEALKMRFPETKNGGNVRMTEIRERLFHRELKLIQEDFSRRMEPLALVYALCLNQLFVECESQ